LYPFGNPLESVEIKRWVVVEVNNASLDWHSSL